MNKTNNKYNKLFASKGSDSLKRMDFKYVFIAVIICLFFIFTFTSSFSLSKLTDITKSDNKTVIEAGSLALELYNESNSIVLDDAIPQTDSDAIANNTEYEFVVRNTGTLNSTFRITLDNTCSVNKNIELNGESFKVDKCIPNEYIKVALKEGESKYEVLEYDKEKYEYIIDADKLKAGEERNYKMKIWLVLNTPNEYNPLNDEVITFLGKLNVDYEQGEEEYLENVYVVSYDTNGGTGTMTDERVDRSENITLKENQFTREGYLFTGYSLEKDGKATYKAGDTISEMTDLSGGIVKFYAVWEPITYVVKYKANGGIGTMDDSTHTYDKDSILSQNEFVREGYIFTGWSTLSIDDEVMYKDKGKVKNLTTSNNGTVILYAVWEAYKYEIVFDSNGASGNIDSEMLEEGEEIVLSGNEYTKDGYTFAGWGTSKDGDAIYKAGDSVKDLASLGNSVTLYAIWEPVSYEIKYDSNGGNGSMVNSTYKYDELKSLLKNTFTKTGYTFIGWNTSSSATEALYSDEESIKNLTNENNKVITLYAIWKVNVYTISYYLGNGVSTAGSTLIGTSTCTYNSTCALKTWSSLGKTFPGSTNKWSFEGWSSSQTGISVKYVNGGSFKYNTDGNISLYALGSRTFKFYSGLSANLIYQEKQYWNPYSTSSSYVTSITVPEAIEIDGWNFYGYRATNQASSTATIKITGTYKGSATSLTSMEFRTIYKREVFVNYNANGGSSSTSSTTGTQYYNCGMTSGANVSIVSITLANNNFTKTGYTFSKWALGSVSGAEYSAGSTYNFNNGVTEEDNVTMYAKWTINTYTANVVVQNGVVDGLASKSSNYNTDITFNLIPNERSLGVVTCTNNQTGAVENNVLTVKNISSNTTCTVKFMPTTTVLYSDGTLIINENSLDRASNITKHGSVSREYEAMSATNSYVFSSEASQPWFNEKSSVINVEVGQVIKPTSTAYWFRELRNMKFGDFTNLDTSFVTNMRFMFNYTGYNTSTFELVGVDGFDVSNVIYMNNLFDHAGYSTTTSWKIGDLSNWNVSKVTSFVSMFASTCRNAPVCNIGDLSSWNVSKVTNMSGMFTYYGTATENWDIGDISGWDVSNVTTFASMFGNAASNAKKIDINLDSWVLSKATAISSMFYYFGSNATEWNVGTLANWNVSKVKDFTRVFSGAGQDSSSFVLDLSNWNVSSATDMSNMFNYGGAFSEVWSIGDISNWDVSRVTNMEGMFHYAGIQASTFNLDLSSWDISSVTNLNRMFDRAGYAAQNWSIGDLSSWDVSNVTDMGVMFAAAGYISDRFFIGDLSSWDTSKVINMERMFEGTGSYSNNFVSIGTLVIPSNCNVSNFGWSDDLKNGSRAFSGNLVISGSLSNYANMLRMTATNGNSRLNLYYDNSEAEAIVDELISLYGPNGTVTQGKIYKIANAA